MRLRSETLLSLCREIRGSGNSAIFFDFASAQVWHIVMFNFDL